MQGVLQPPYRVFDGTRRHRSVHPPLLVSCSRTGCGTWNNEQQQYHLSVSSATTCFLPFNVDYWGHLPHHSDTHSAKKYPLTQRRSDQLSISEYLTLVLAQQ